MSYTLAYTGAEIDALLGKIDAIFVAEYGSTIYSEVTAAIAAGNKVIVANAGKVFVYAGTDDNSGYVFTQSGPNAAKPNATYVTLSTGNVWSTATVDLATVQQFYASLMEDTASGSIASFPDGAENVPVKELTAEIEPIQDLHGQASPYPAGGGKNKLPLDLATIKSLNTSGTWSGNAYARSGMTYTVLTDNGGNVVGIQLNGTSSIQYDFMLSGAIDSGSYTLNGCPSGGGSSTYRIIASHSGGSYVDSGSGVTFTAAITGTLIRVSANVAVSNLLFKPMLRLSTEADATFAPYSNICPISGYTGATIVNGQNAYDADTTTPNKYVTPYGYIDNAGSSFITDYIPLTSTLVFYFNYSSLASSNLRYIAFYNSSKTFISSADYDPTEKKHRFIAPTNTAFVRLTFDNNATDIVIIADGTTHNIDWTDEAGTVYGGHFVVNEDGSVDLTVDFGPYTGDLGTRFWEIISGNGPDYFQTNIVTSLDISRRAELLCNKYKTQTPSATYTGDCITGFTSSGQLRIRDSRYTTVEDFEASLSDVVIAYPRNTVQTYHLDSIGQITTLLGDNNIWADTGDISVKYRANTALYIEKELGE